MLLAREPAQRPGYAWTYIPYADRNDALQRRARVYLTGEYHDAVVYLSSVAEHEEREGRIARAVDTLCTIAQLELYLQRCGAETLVTTRYPHLLLLAAKEVCRGSRIRAAG